MKKVMTPNIIAQNTYFWSPAGNASNRRNNEKRHQDAVANFFAKLGLEVEVLCDTVTGEGEGISVQFHYSESCKNVYKTFTVHRNGKKSNVRGLAAWAKKQGIALD